MSKLFENKLRVRYGETDQMGFVYYGNYALYLEVARTELIRHSGVSYKKLEEQGLELPVINLTINYRKPAAYDELLTIYTKIIGPIGKKIAFHSEIRNEKEELIIKAEVELIFIHSKTKKVITCPSALIEKLQSYQWD